MYKGILILLLIFPIGVIYSQQVVSLELCHEKTVENYPLLKKKAILVSIEETEKEKLSKNFLPEINLNAQVHYQSDVTKVPINENPMFSIEPLANDWYKASLDLQQLIYDGGATAKQKKMSEADRKVEEQNIAIELHRLKQRVDAVFFSILSLQKRKEILKLHLETLRARLKEINAGVENGILLKSNADQISVEILEAEASLNQLVVALNTAIDILNQYTGLGLNDKSTFVIPQSESGESNAQEVRPEIMLFSLQNSKLETSRSLLDSKNKPMVSAFGQAGYGRPGLDMLNTDFTDYYMIGARLSWKLWDWKKTDREKELIGLKQKLINTEQETFNYNLNLQLKEKLSAIQKLDKQIEKDAEIISLRKAIVKSKEAELKNGTINASEYIMELNAASRANLDLEIHRIEKAKAWISYRAVKGNY